MANKNKSGNKTYLADKETLDGLYDDIGDSDDTDGGYGFGTINAKLNYIINYKLGEAGGGVLETISILPSQSNTLTYNGQMQSPTWNNYNPNKLDIGGTLEAHNAGEYKAAFVPKAGYKWENADTIKNISWYIGGTEIALPTVTNTMTYNGSEQYPIWSGYDSSKMSIGGVTKATDAGNYNTTFLPLTGCVWSDGTSEMKSVQWNIAKAQGSLSIDKTEASLNPANSSIIINVTKVGDGQLTAVSSNTNVCTTSISGNQVTITYVNGGDATVTISLLEGINYTSAQSKIVNVVSTSFVRYGVRIKKSESNPYNRVEYIYDAVGMTPVKMNLSTGEFDYGSWEDVWFIKNNKPVMLNYDGTEAYELDPNDQTKKLDGTTSDVSNISFNGNAMARIPLCWLYMYEDSNYEYLIVSNGKYDNNYKAYAHTKGDGTVVDNLYLGMYRASINSSEGRAKSFSSRTADTAHYQMSDKLTYVLNNNPSNISNGNSGWYVRTWSQRNLINILLTIIGKSDDTQSVFGTGYVATYVYTTSNKQNYYNTSTGGTVKKGRFYGTNSDSGHIKVFYIEDWWGASPEQINGLVFNRVNNTEEYHLRYKMTGPYVTEVSSSIYIYDLVSTGPSKTLSGCIKNTTSGDFGRLPVDTNEDYNSSYVSYVPDNVQLVEENFVEVGCTPKVQTSYTNYNKYIGAYCFYTDTWNEADRRNTYSLSYL